MSIFTNGNITSPRKSNSHSIKLLNDLAQIKSLNPQDLHSFLEQDHTSFSVLSLSAKHILSTSRLSITLSKNSAKSFYLGSKASAHSAKPLQNPPLRDDDCLQDAQHCLYFSLFNSKEKKLYSRFIDKVEANFEGVQYLEPSQTAYNPPLNNLASISNQTSSQPTSPKTNNNSSTVKSTQNQLLKNNSSFHPTSSASHRSNSTFLSTSSHNSPDLSQTGSKLNSNSNSQNLNQSHSSLSSNSLNSPIPQNLANLSPLDPTSPRSGNLNNPPNSNQKNLISPLFNSSKKLAVSNLNLPNPTSPRSNEPHPPTSNNPPLTDPPKSPPNPTCPPSDKPKQRLEASFNSTSQSPSLRVLDTRPLLFLTLTFNTTNQDYHAWTTNWDKSDPCWDRLNKKEEWLKSWAWSFDNQAEPFKVPIPPVKEDVSQYNPALRYLQLFLRRVRRLWKPLNWKWVVVSELQKNGNWHFHLLSTPIVPYSHQCTLTKNFKPCWNCCAYLSELWPYGRVNSQSPGEQSISKYLAKYLSKSFHLRKLYQDHGLKENSKTYSFFKNLYSYQTKPAILKNKSRLDGLSGQFLNNNQAVFRHYDYSTGETSYFYRTQETLVGQAQKPRLLKKNYRLATRSLNPLNLLKLAQKSPKEEKFLFKKPTSSGSKTNLPPFNLNPHSPPRRAITTNSDFQEFLITNLLTFCQSAEFLHLPLEQDQVPKLKSKCDKAIYHHFKPKPILHFKFTPEVVPMVLSFLNNLDSYAEEYDIEESSQFYDSRFTDPVESRNAYLNHWQVNTYSYRKEQQIYHQGQSSG